MNSTTQPAAMGVADFCKAHSVSRALLYKLWKVGAGPDVMKVGKRTLITTESAAKWRRRMEAQTAEGVA